MKKYAFVLLAVTVTASFALTALGVGRSGRTSSPANGEDGSKKKETLIIRGSTTLRPISSRVMSVFNKYHDVEVWQDAFGSSQGIRSLLEGTCYEEYDEDSDLCDFNGDGTIELPAADIAQASRRIRSSEVDWAEALGFKVVEQVVAKDGIAMIVNTGNDVVELYADPDILFMYTNPNIQDFDWVDLGLGTLSEPIIPVSRTPESGTFGAFIELYLDQACESQGGCADDPEGLLLDNPEVVFVGSNDEVVDYVLGNVGAVGYVGIAFVSPDVKNVPVALNDSYPTVAASFQTVQDGTFFFSRGLFTYTLGIPQACDKRSQWLEHVQSRLGQIAVFEAGYVPVIPYEPIMGNDGAAQILLEGEADFILKEDESNIAWRLEVIAQAEEMLNDGDPDNDDEAETLSIESQFAIEEYYINDNRIVQQLMDRVQEGIDNGCPMDQNKAESELSQAQAEFAQAMAQVAGCSPTYPVSCNLNAFKGWLRHLGKAFEHAAKAMKECTGQEPGKCK